MPDSLRNFFCGPLRLPALILVLALAFSWPLTPIQHFLASSIISDSSNHVSAEQKAQLQQVATLLGNVYDTLAEMQYLDPKGIVRGPHDLSRLDEHLDNYSLDPAVKYLYSILPHIDVDEAGNRDFFHGSSFFDFLNPGEIEQSRDPFYASPEGDDFDADGGPYMRPWYTPLSTMGNHGTVLIYDTRSNRIWAIDQEGWLSTDQGLENAGRNDFQKLSVNENRFEHIPSRPATEFLRDLNNWYRELEELPGQGEESYPDWTEEDQLRILYRQSGWPDRFDGDVFLIKQARAHCAEDAKYHAEEPIRQVEQFEGWSKYNAHDVERHTAELREAKNEDEAWLARFELCKAEQGKVRNDRSLAEKQRVAAQMCPGGVCQRTKDLPLWEVEMLRVELKWMTEGAIRPEHYQGGQDDKAYLAAKRHHERKRQAYQRAFDEAKSEADRLRPDVTFYEATGIKTLGHQGYAADIANQRSGLTRLQDERQELQTWSSQVPAAAVKCHAAVQSSLEQYRHSEEETRGQIARAQQWFDEHGEDSQD